MLSQLMTSSPRSTSPDCLQLWEGFASTSSKLTFDLEESHSTTASTGAREDDKVKSLKFEPDSVSAKTKERAASAESIMGGEEDSRGVEGEMCDASERLGFEAGLMAKESVGRRANGNEEEDSGGAGEETCDGSERFRFERRLVAEASGGRRAKGEAEEDSRGAKEEMRDAGEDLRFEVDAMVKEKKGSGEVRNGEMNVESAKNAGKTIVDRSKRPKLVELESARTEDTTIANRPHSLMKMTSAQPTFDVVKQLKFDDLGSQIDSSANFPEFVAESSSTIFFEDGQTQRSLPTLQSRILKTVVAKKKFQWYDDSSAHGSPAADTQSPLFVANAHRVISPLAIASFSSQISSYSAPSPYVPARPIRAVVAAPKIIMPIAQLEMPSTILPVVVANHSPLDINSELTSSLFLTGRGQEKILSGAALHQAQIKFGMTPFAALPEPLMDSASIMLSSSVSTGRGKVEEIFVGLQHAAGLHKVFETISALQLATSKTANVTGTTTSSIFATGSGRLVKISNAALAAASSKFDVPAVMAMSLLSTSNDNNASLKVIPPVATSLPVPISSQAQIVGTERPLSPVQPHTLALSFPNNKNDTVQSIFSTGNGKRMMLSSEALERASRTLAGDSGGGKVAAATTRADPMGPNATSATTPLTSIFSSGTGKQMTLSAASLEKAAKVVCEFATPAPRPKSFVSPLASLNIALPSSASRSGGGYSSSKPFSRPRAVALKSIISSSSAASAATQRRPAVLVKVFVPRLRLPPLHVSKKHVIEASYERNDLLTLNVTSENAICVSLIDRPSFSKSYFCPQTLDSLRAELLTKYSDKDVTLDWLANHYRWVVWKLACAERLVLNGANIKPLTYANVAKQLESRAQCEFDRRQRSVLWRILTKAAPSTTCSVLVLSRVLIEENADGSSLVEVSDGWYGCEALLDPNLSRMLRSNPSTIYVGKKIVVSHAYVDWGGSSEGRAPLDLISNKWYTEKPNEIDFLAISTADSSSRAPRLQISFNGTKPARWDATLGARVHVAAITKSLANLRVGGGIVPRLELFVYRAWPTLFREEIADSSCELRNQEEEDKAVFFHTERVAMYRERVSRELFNDASTSREDFMRLLEDRLNNDPNAPKPRRVTCVKRILVKDKSSYVVRELTIWRPTQQLCDQLSEGNVVGVTSVSIASISKMFGGYGSPSSSPGFRLMASTTSRWSFRGGNNGKNWEAYRCEPRAFGEAKQEHEFVDTVLVWLAISPETCTAFAARVDPSASDDELIGISHARNRSESLNFVPGKLVAVRDLKAQAFDSRLRVLNCHVHDATTFCIKPSGSAARHGFSHLVAAFEEREVWLKSAMGYVESRVARAESILFGGVVVPVPVSVPVVNLYHPNHYQPFTPIITPMTMSLTSMSTTTSYDGGYAAATPVMSAMSDSSRAMDFSTPHIIAKNYKLTVFVTYDTWSHMVVGRKTVDARLCNGIFAGEKVAPGVVLRYTCGPNSTQDFDVLDVRPYASFSKLLEFESVKRILPSFAAGDVQGALKELRALAGPKVANEMEIGVVAIELRAKDVLQTPPLVLKRAT